MMITNLKNTITNFQISKLSTLKSKLKSIKIVEEPSKRRNGYPNKVFENNSNDYTSNLNEIVDATWSTDDNK